MCSVTCTCAVSAFPVQGLCGGLIHSAEGNPEGKAGVDVSSLRHQQGRIHKQRSETYALIFRTVSLLLSDILLNFAHAGNDRDCKGHL